MGFRQHLLEKHTINTVRTIFARIISIYKYYDIEILDLPPINSKGAIVPEPITFKDLPDKEVIRQAINIATPTIKPIIYFMASRGCARTET